MSLMQIAGLYIAASDIAGRGVFCAQRIDSGDVIEVCPVIVLPAESRSWLDRSVLFEYYFVWGEERKEAAVALGYGSLYNHSEEPNAVFMPDLSDNTIIFSAVQQIPASTEITIDYHAGIGKALWFEPQ